MPPSEGGDGKNLAASVHPELSECTDACLVEDARESTHGSSESVLLSRESRELIDAAQKAAFQAPAFVEQGAEFLFREDCLLLLGSGLDSDALLLRLLRLLQLRTPSSPAGADDAEMGRGENGSLGPARAETRVQWGPSNLAGNTPSWIPSAAWPRLVLILGLAPSEFASLKRRQEIQHRRQRRVIAAAASALRRCEGTAEQKSLFRKEATLLLERLADSQRAERVEALGSACRGPQGGTAFTWKGRQRLYAQGGCFSVPAAVVASDFLSGRLAPELVDCLVFPRAER